jgi:hypothetical protein
MAQQIEDDVALNLGHTRNAWEFPASDPGHCWPGVTGARDTSSFLMRV